MHAITKNDLIKDVCKFYIQGSCSKGESCAYMHNILWSIFCTCDIVKGDMLYPQGVSVISRHEPFGRSASSDVIGERVQLDV